MIVLRVIILKNFLDKTKGLLFAKKAHAVFFKTRFGIHTFGLLFPIDVLILDKSHTVVKFSEHLLPNSVFLWNPFFNRVIELPAGEIKKLKIGLGNKIKLIEVKPKASITAK